MAKKFKLPFVIHCRESIDETIELLKSINDSSSLAGVFHCFTGTVQQAEEINVMGYKLGIGGVATFKNGGLEEVLEAVSLENILLETDSPYLAPVPYRGKRNEPSYVANVCEKVASVKNIDVDDVAGTTTANSLTLFNQPINAE
jgi:TatD DNase family protein